MARAQFTFYESFFKAVSRIRKAQDRAAAYDMICAYALYQQEPDLDKAPDSVAIAFDLLRPVLDKAREKAESGKTGGSKPKGTVNQTGSKPEANDKLEIPPSKKEGEKEKEVEGEKEVEVEKEKEVEIDNISPIIVPTSTTTEREEACTAGTGYEPPPSSPQGLGCNTHPVVNDGKSPYGVHQLVRLTPGEYDLLVSTFGELNTIVAIAQMGEYLRTTPETEWPKSHYTLLAKKLWNEPTIRDNEP